MHIQNMICIQMPYGGGIISHDASTNDEFGDDVSAKWVRRSPRVTRLVRRGFGVILREFFKIWNLYAKNIMFGCSLPTSTSTWHSDHHNGPGGYMSGELKLENINMEKAPTQQSHYPEKIIQLSHRIQLHLRKILFKEPKIQFLYELQRPSRPKDPHGLQFTHKYNKSNDLDHSLR
jgi:hypothetical protein